MTTSGDDHAALREHGGLYVLDALTPVERADFEAHETACGACANDVRDMRMALAALGGSIAPIAPRPILRKRVLAAAAFRRKSRRTLPWVTATAALLLVAGLGLRRR